MRNRLRTKPNPAQAELRRVIYLHGKSLHQVALAIGYDPSYLTRICNGERGIVRQDFLARVMDYLNLSQYERARLMWMCGWLAPGIFPETLSEEVFTMLTSLRARVQLTSSSERTNHNQKNQPAEVQQL